MKIQRTLVTLLAAMLAVIGMTGTVVHAEGPGTDGSGGTNMTPANVLSGGDLANWNALTSENQTILTQKIIPEIAERVLDASLRPGVLAGLVAVTLDIQKQRERDAQLGNTGPSQGATGASSAPRVKCYLAVNASAHGATAKLSCPAQMHKITVSVQLSREGEDQEIGSTSQTCSPCSSEWTAVTHTPIVPCEPWYATGSGRATGKQPNGPFPDKPTYGPHDDRYCTD